MAERQVGYAPVCAISDNGAGFVRVGFPAWALDNKLFAAATVGAWNVCNLGLVVPEAQTITAKGGAEGTGYWFDTALPFAGTTWTSAHRYAPQLSAVILLYSSLALAEVPTVNGDQLYVWDYDTAGSQNHTYSWTGNSYFTTKLPSGWGGRSHGQISISSWGTTFFMGIGGANLAAVPTIVWQNLTFRGYSQLFTWRALGGTPGGGIQLDRLFVDGCAYGFWDSSGAALNVTHRFTNNMFIGGVCALTFGVNTGPATVVEHCTIMCQDIGVNNASKPVTYTNVFAWECRICYDNKLNGTYTKCASNDATGSEAGLRSVSRAQAALWRDNDRGYFSCGGNILTTSICWHAGVPATEAADIYGVPRDPAHPTIGCHEGTLIPYNSFFAPPTWGPGEVSGVHA